MARPHRPQKPALFSRQSVLALPVHTGVTIIVTPVFRFPRRELQPTRDSASTGQAILAVVVSCAYLLFEFEGNAFMAVKVAIVTL